MTPHLQTFWRKVFIATQKEVYNSSEMMVKLHHRDIKHHSYPFPLSEDSHAAWFTALNLIHSELQLALQPSAMHRLSIDANHRHPAPLAELQTTVATCLHILFVNIALANWLARRMLAGAKLLLSAGCLQSSQPPVAIQALCVYLDDLWWEYQLF